jgi:hypothetical protein
MRVAYKIGIFATLLEVAPAAAASQSDIVWPTYDQARQVADGLLNCGALDKEIAHTAADVELLEHAKARVEDVLHSAFDMERYGGTNSPGGQRIAGGSVYGKEAYSAARGQIVESLRVAQKRRDWLQTLKPSCKPAP